MSVSRPIGFTAPILRGPGESAPPPVSGSGRSADPGDDPWVALRVTVRPTAFGHRPCAEEILVTMMEFGYDPERNIESEQTVDYAANGDIARVKTVGQRFDAKELYTRGRVWRAWDQATKGSTMFTFDVRMSWRDAFALLLSRARKDDTLDGLEEDLQNPAKLRHRIGEMWFREWSEHNCVRTTLLRQLVGREMDAFARDAR